VWNRVRKPAGTTRIRFGCTSDDFLEEYSNS
jgi:hypothetical protein